MSIFWAVVAVTALVLIVYAMVSARLTEQRRRKAREKVLPCVEEAFANDMRYDLRLADGRCFGNVEILGATAPKDGRLPFGGWEGLLVLRLDDGRKAWLRPSSIRCMAEASAPRVA